MFTLPFWAFERKEGDTILAFIWWFVSGISIVIMVILALLYDQSAVLSEKGIKLRSKISKIKTILWHEIYKIGIETLPSGTAGVSIIYKTWVVIYTEKEQKREHGGVNKKKGPWYISATKANIDAINFYIDKYTNLEKIGLYNESNHKVRSI